MEIRQLQTFKEISQSGSFAKAALSLGYTQPALTAHIHSLEKELQVKLFERLGGKIHLTHEGVLFLEYAKKILALASESKFALSPAAKKNRLIIGASETFSVLRLPELLKDFRLQYPETDIDLVFGTLPLFHQSLQTNQIDLAFILAEQTDSPNIHTEFLNPEPMAFISAPSHPLASSASLTLQDLSREIFIATQEGCAYRMYLENLFEENHIQPERFMKVKNLEAIKQFVISNLGIALIPEIYVEKELASRTLIKLPWNGPSFNLYTQLSYHKDKWLSDGLTNFLKVARDHFPNKDLPEK